MKTLDFQNGLERLSEFAKTEGLELHGSAGAPSAARAFAELLILQQDEVSAIALLRKDLEGVQAFLCIAHFVSEELRVGRIEPDWPLPDKRLPFYAVASAVIEFVDGFREHRPEYYH